MHVTAENRTLHVDERADLAALVQQLGEIAAANELGVARGTLARAVAGFPLTNGNAHMIRARLAVVKGATP